MLDAESVAISNSTRQPWEDRKITEVDGPCPGIPSDEISYLLVIYPVQANFTTASASQLLEVLDRQGAVGLETRLRALRDSGVIDTP